MQVTIDIPDSVADSISASGQEASRSAVEGLALEGYRSGILSESAVRQLLGFETRMEVHEFLAEHDVDLNYSMADWKHDKRMAGRNLAG